MKAVISELEEQVASIQANQPEEKILSPLEEDQVLSLEVAAERKSQIEVEEP